MCGNRLTSAASPAFSVGQSLPTQQLRLRKAIKYGYLMPRAAMAKKRKKGKEPEKEEYEFIPPEFDEEDFIRKELRDSKAVIVTVIYAILLGVLAGVVSVLNRSFVGLAFLIAIAGMVTLKPIYDFLKIDTKGFQKRNWAGNIGTFFFTFLAIWVLMMNTPFADFTNPRVSEVIVWVDNNDGSPVRGMSYTQGDGTYTWEQLNDTYPATIVLESNQTINITAKVADNGKLRTVEIALGVPTNYASMTKSSVDSRYEYSVSVADIEREFFIRAVDSAGNSVNFQPQVPLPIS